MIVKLEYYGISDGNELYAPKRVISPIWEKIYKNKILNFDSLNFEKESKSLRKIGTANDDYEYLIICNDKFIPKIKPLACWKTRKGIRTKIDSLSVVGITETDIKNHITNEYKDNNIEYVLLVGDEADLMMTSTGPGDYWYSNLSGDIKPEIAIGRISAANLNETEHIVSKIMTYGLDPPLTDWLKKSLLVAHKEGAPGKYQGCKEEIRTYSNYSPQLTFATAYGASVLNGGDEATNTDVTSSIDVGIGIVNYRGHGSYDSWLSWNILNKSYTTSDARGLTNGYKTPIVFSIACSNSQLDSPSECLAEAFTKADYGTTEFLGAT